ncbi:branched-chain amino acid transport system permease protein [Azospirillum fermentarium]|uniref:branched-chain amino acid ABC transporter permease n=1 Tax=Azospirillum fermentarium TaxID=1233114 RepID=UPI0022264E08|nr:branched-chain amino acid ABC transporter permease [Azospirillum fermentarium]MCW2246180.1 branched-chain amino acid transport system permease protein [Azospirillum fermentarium]
MLAQLVLNGAALGAAYALVALGFVLVLNAAGAVNFAHGDLVMAGGMLGAVLGPMAADAVGPVPGAVLLPLVLLLMAGLGVLVAAVAYLPLRRKPPVAVFVTTIAVGIMLQNGANTLLGGEPRAAPPLLSGGTVTLWGGVTAPEQSLAVIAAAAVLIALQVWVFGHTHTGRRLRAAAQDPDMARACGIPVTRMVLATFAIGSAYAGAAGLLLANQYFVTPHAGGDLILKAYIAVTVGGWGSVPGAVLGALLIAGFEVGVSAALSYPVAQGALYLTLLLMLVLRPQGLLGEAARRRA